MWGDDSIPQLPFFLTMVQDAPSQAPEEPPDSYTLGQSSVSLDHCYLSLSENSKALSSPSSEDTDTESLWTQEEVRVSALAGDIGKGVSCCSSSLSLLLRTHRPTPKACSLPVMATMTIPGPPPGRPQPCPQQGGRPRISGLPGFPRSPRRARKSPALPR